MTNPERPEGQEPDVSYALLRAAFDTVGEAIICINSNSIIVTTNAEIEEVFGYRPEELLGKHLHLVMPEKYREMHSTGLKRYLSTGIANVLGVRLELEGLKKDGTVFPLEIRITSTLVSEQRFFTAAMRDITHRREQERQLQEQQRQLQRLVYFFTFTLENMELALHHGAEPAELLKHVQQVQVELAAHAKDLRTIQ